MSKDSNISEMIAYKTLLNFFIFHLGCCYINIINFGFIFCTCFVYKVSAPDVNRRLCLERNSVRAGAY